MGRAAALLLALLLTAAAASAEGLLQAAYGGSGEDILREAVSCGDGLFAAGTTASADGHLSMRTRKGETGWALRLDAQGGVLFSFCSAKSGMTRMTAPTAHPDGTYAVVLTDGEGQRGEWLLLDGYGDLLHRQAVPQAAQLRPDGGSIRRMTPIWTQSGAALAVSAGDEGTETIAIIDKDGAAVSSAALDCAGRCALTAARKRLVHAHIDGGALALSYVDPDDGACETLRVQPPAALGTIDGLLSGGDESAALCGEAADGSGYLLRVSRMGEVLFFLELPHPASCLTATDTGFAVLAGGEIVFADEDGAYAATAPAPERTLCLTASLDGAAALSHEPARGRRQAVFTHIAQPVMQPQDDAAERIAPGPQEAETTLTAGDGYLVCSAADGFGVQVTHIAADGTQRFATRTPIHTAADALEWCCAMILDDGSILLGGRYLTGEGEAQRQQAVTAWLTEGGVLRGMETLDGAGAVCAMEATQGGVLLHTAAEGEPSLESSGEALFNGLE